MPPARDSRAGGRELRHDRRCESDRHTGCIAADRDLASETWAVALSSVGRLLRRQFAYVIIDVVPGRGGMFSLEDPEVYGS